MKKKGERHRLLEEFRRGLTEPSLPALLVALATMAVLALSSALLLNEERAATVLLGYLPESGLDYYLFTTRKTLLRDGLPSGAPGLVIMGGSATRESLPGDSALQNALFGPGTPGRVRVLGGGALTTWEMRAIAERLPQDFSGVVVLGVNPLRLTKSDKTLRGLLSAPRLGFRSTALDAEAGIAGNPPPPAIPPAHGQPDPWPPTGGSTPLRYGQGEKAYRQAPDERDPRPPPAVRQIQYDPAGSPGQDDRRPAHPAGGPDRPSGITRQSSRFREGKGCADLPEAPSGDGGFRRGPGSSLLASRRGGGADGGVLCRRLSRRQRGSPKAIRGSPFRQAGRRDVTPAGGRIVSLRARTAGILLQGAVLGTLLFFALLVMASMAEGVRIFRYQGF